MDRLVPVSVTALVALIVFAFVLLGWLAPLVWGIVRILRKRRYGGFLTALGGAWGGLVVIGVVALVLLTRAAMRDFTPVAFDPSTYEGKTGWIAVPHPGRGVLALHLTDSPSSETTRASSRYLQLASDSGRFVCPTGVIGAINSYELSEPDGDGQDWTASGNLLRERLAFGAEVRDGETLELDIGPPFTASVKARKRGEGQAALALSITGREGGSYMIYRTSLGLIANPPRFQVLSQAGDVLWEEKMEYG